MLEEIKEVYRKYGGSVVEYEKFEGDVDVGYTIEYEKRIEEVDVCFFGLASGDLNPIHFDEDVAKTTKFGGRVVHGVLTLSIVSAAVARMPGLPVLLDASFRFMKPVRIGDTVRVFGEVVNRDGRRYRLGIRCLVGDETVAEGTVTTLIW